MLSKVLSKEACAGCRFCCSFRRQSLWELPRLSVEFIEKYKTDTYGNPIKYRISEDRGERFAVTDLTGDYRTDDPEEEVKCPFLDENTGCILPGEDKPFDCSIWPLRYMEKPDGKRCVALTPTCPEINKVPMERLKELVEEGLGERIAEYADTHPYMIKEYRDGFEILWSNE